MCINAIWIALAHSGGAAHLAQRSTRHSFKAEGGSGVRVQPVGETSSDHVCSSGGAAHPALRCTRHSFRAEGGSGVRDRTEGKTSHDRVCGGTGGGAAGAEGFTQAR